MEVWQITIKDAATARNCTVQAMLALIGKGRFTVYLVPRIGPGRHKRIQVLDRREVANYRPEKGGRGRKVAPLSARREAPEGPVNG